jgi:MFS family permease
MDPLRDRTYSRLFAAQVISLVGTGMTTVALGLLAYKIEQSNAGAILGIVFGLKMIAYVGVAPLAAAFAHRIPQKSLLIGLDLTRALIILILPFVGTIWEVFVLVFIVNACSAAFTPAFQALIPVVLPDEEQYTQALSLSRIAYEMEGLLSPVLAALALAAVGLNALFVTDAASFVVSAGVILTLTLPAPRAGEVSARTRRRITRGIRNYLVVPRLRGLLALDFAVACASAMVIVNTVVFVRSDFDLSASAVAWALAVAGGGSMIAAFAVPGLLRRFSERSLMIGGGVVLIAGLAIAGFAGSYGELLFAWFFLGIGLAVVQTPSGRLIQRSVRGDDGPDLFAAQFSLSHACWLVTYPAAGALGTALGLQGAAYVLAFAAAASVVVASVVWRIEPIDGMASQS